MATTTLTSNLKLRVSSDLSSDSKYNLEKIDSLGSVYQVDTTQTVNLRSVTNITLQPNSPDIGGSGTGGSVSIGSVDQPISAFNLYADTVSLSASLSLSDQAVGGTRSLNIGYKSDITGVVDTTADRNLLFDLEGSDRNVTLGGDFATNGQITLSVTGPSSLTLPTTGSVLSDVSVDTVSNKTLDFDNNTVTNVRNINVAADAAIVGTKIDPSFGAQEVNSTTGFSSTPGVAFVMPSSDGTAGQVMVTNGLGNLSFAVAATTSLPENYVRIGNSSNQQEAVDTDILGDIQATTAGGLDIKAGVITDAEVNASAGIALSKLGSATPSRALQTSGIGTVEVSAVTATELGYVSGVTSAIQTQLDIKQNADADLTAIAGLTGTGIITRAGDGNAVLRSLAAGSTKITITNADGFLGNPTVDLGTVSTDDITEGTNLFYTDERSQDSVGTILTNTASISWTYDDVTPTITAQVIPGGVDHDSLAGYVSNQHVDHTIVTINTNADSGLTGGGDISASRSLSVDILGTTAEAGVDTADSILIYDVTAAALRRATVANVVAAAEAATFKTNWTQVDGSSISITHNLGTLDVAVELYDTADGSTFYPDTITRPTINSINITGNNLPATFDFRVLIREVK